MELNLEAAFSSESLVGHLTYVLVIISMMMRTMWLLRVFVTASACAGIAYAAIWLHDPVIMFWEALLMVVNLVQLAITYFQNRQTRFTEEEAAFVDDSFPGLSRKLKRRLLDAGQWADAPAELALVKEGSPVPCLYYLADGEAKVTANGKAVGHCEKGDFVGEMTAMSGKPANGTVVLTGPARYWSAPAEKLRHLAARHEEIGQALQASFLHGVMAKLLRANHVSRSEEALAGLGD